MRKLLFVAVCLLVLVGCTKTEYITVERVRIDTTYITQHQRDSIYLHDSTVVHDVGDTVKIEKWHTKYIEKEVHDTIYKAKLDSVPKPYPVEVEVERQLTWWQQARLHLANIVLYALLILGIGYIIKRKFFS